MAAKSSPYSSHNRKAKGGKAKRDNQTFTPTKAQRDAVKLLIGAGFPVHRTAATIINPRTNKCIEEKTLQRHFSDEIAHGQARLQSEIMHGWRRAFKRGERWAQEWALKHLCGFRDNAALLSIGGQAEGARDINVVFVAPDGEKYDELPERHWQDPPPRTIEGRALPPPQPMPDTEPPLRPRYGDTPEPPPPEPKVVALRPERERSRSEIEQWTVDSNPRPFQSAWPKPRGKNEWMR